MSPTRIGHGHGVAVPPPSQDRPRGRGTEDGRPRTDGRERTADAPPTEEDLLVIYLDGPVPDDLVARLETHGGTRVLSPNPYWNEWGVTVEDPDGYRLVLCTRAWANS